MHRKFPAILPLLLLSLGCSRTDDAAKNTAHEPIDAATEHAASQPSQNPPEGILTKGALCASWPKNVPVFPGAAIVACNEVAARDGGPSDKIAALAVRQNKDAGTPPPLSALLALNIQTTASPADVVAFYKKQLSRYPSATQSVLDELSTTTFANTSDAADPVWTVLLMPMNSTPDGKTSAPIMVLLKKM